MKLLSVAKRLLLGKLPGGRRHCAVCDRNVWRFLPYRQGQSNPLMIALGGVGSDTHNFECPNCGAHDRERHLLLYLRRLRLLEEMRGRSILHFAPERRLAERIRDVQPALYVRCDLYPQFPEIQKVDMLRMEFESNSFDVILANHVLEHVACDLTALAEVRRVLKSGGYAILQTPYCGKLHATWEDPGIADEVARLQAYGQEDHVRLYGRDIFNRIAASGLVSEVQSHKQLLRNFDAAIEGVNPQEPLFLFRKP